MPITRNRTNALGRWELLAIALGGMVGGGIFSILGIAVSNVGDLTPFAVGCGGVLAMLAAYSYVKLAKLYRDEGATYSFFKRTFPGSRLAASSIGWAVIFGYVSTLALYAFTFGSYLSSSLGLGESPVATRLAAAAVLLFFAGVNLVSVRGMGKVEDLMVFTKLVFLAVIAVVLLWHGEPGRIEPLAAMDVGAPLVLMTAAITFVAFEGFQLAIHATEETADPDRDIPWAIYASIIVATSIYVLLAAGALAAIPEEDLIRNKEAALAAGATQAIGRAGGILVVLGAVLATASAISGTIFGASRLMAVIAKDGYFPAALARRRRGHTPGNAVVTMTLAAILLVLLGDLEAILEFGSITFILVSLLMAIANYARRAQTGSHPLVALAAITVLGAGTVGILAYQWLYRTDALLVTLGLYALLALCAAAYGRKRRR